MYLIDSKKFTTSDIVSDLKKINEVKKQIILVFNKIDLIDNFYVQKLNKDYVLVKIKYLGKINKIINKLKDQNINLKMIAGQWQLTII